VTAKGVFPILPTPFTMSGELDLGSLDRLIKFQIEVGVSGVAILGFMGEAHKLSESERSTIIERVVQASNNIDVWVGVRALGTMGAVEQALMAEKLGADAIFVAPIRIQNDEVLYNHYKTVSESVNIPIIIHDYPEPFGVKISAELAAKLGREEICKYIKLEDPPVGPKLTKIRELSNDKLGVFGGLGGKYFLEELERGSLGIMTGFAFPEILVRIYQLFSDGKKEDAATVFDKYIPFIRYEFQPQIGLAFRKYIYHRRGIFDTTHVRAPATELDEYTKSELVRNIKRVGLTIDSKGVQNIQI